MIDYDRRDDVLDVTYTGTRIRFRGRGYASEVTLRDIRAHGWKVHPICPFTVDYLDDHPEFADPRVWPVTSAALSPSSSPDPEIDQPAEVAAEPRPGSASG